MRSLAQHIGSWTGVNEFRLMPADPPHRAQAAADVSLAAAGNLVAIAYTWSHPDDGAQDGLLVVGPSEEPGGVLALWGDSWHQSPQPKVLVGVTGDGLLVASYEYGGGWQWQITVDATDADSLRVRMDNIIPESAATDAVPASAYPTMEADLRRAHGTVTSPGTDH